MTRNLTFGTLARVGLLALSLLQLSCLHQWLHPHDHEVREVVAGSAARVGPTSPPAPAVPAPNATDSTPAPLPAPPREPEQGPDASGSIDFARIREEYGDRANFYEICEKNHPLPKLLELTNARQWQPALDVSLRWLAACPVDMHARLIASVSLSKLGRHTDSQEHRFWYMGLVGSVLASGDGRTAETAFVVISILEEYAIVSALGLEWAGQTLLEGGIDEITIKGRPEISSLFFNPAAHWRRLHGQARPNARERRLPAG
jgi:hypothetical protein